MKIAESSIQLSSSRNYISKYQKSETLHEWDTRPQNGEATSENSLANTPDIYEASEETVTKEDFDEAFDRFITTMKFRLFRDLLEEITGQKIDFDDSSEFEGIGEILDIDIPIPFQKFYPCQVIA